MNTPMNATVAASISLHADVASFADRYDGFIVDIWGVVMDGQQPYPRARDCLRALRAIDKQVVLLSNAPRRSAKVAARLRSIGVGDDCYDHIISSGEATRAAIATGSVVGLGSRFVFLGLDDDGDLLDGLDYQRVDTPAAADFLLLTGPNADHDRDGDLGHYQPLLDETLTAGLPLVCANPDHIVVRRTGARIMCAGAIAARYEEMGGQVHWFGKPHAPVYDACFRTFGALDRSRILALGDNLDTDIAGAATVGVDTALVLGGVLAEKLGIAWGENAPVDAIAPLCAARGVMPTHAIPALFWHAE